MFRASFSKRDYLSANIPHVSQPINDDKYSVSTPILLDDKELDATVQLLSGMIRGIELQQLDGDLYCYAIYFRQVHFFIKLCFA